MAIKHFKNVLDQRAADSDFWHPTIFTKKPFGISWGELFFIKNATKYIDFNCGFKDGRCRVHQCNQDKKRQSCCHSCWKQAGYLRAIPENKSFMLYYGNLFKPIDGFFRSKGGCVLPRRMRSLVCVRYTCNYSLLDNVNNELKIDFLEQLEDMQDPGSSHKNDVKAAKKAFEMAKRIDKLAKEGGRI